jgi:hypothetical protein
MGGAATTMRAVVDKQAEDHGKEMFDEASVKKIAGEHFNSDEFHENANEEGFISADMLNELILEGKVAAQSPVQWKIWRR